jgi:ferritin-like metal-binding protein YciE
MHATENPALSIIRPQVGRIEYPEVAAGLEAHISEPEGQIERLDQLLETLLSPALNLKDTAVLGTAAALGNSVAGAEIIKKLANLAFENYDCCIQSHLMKRSTFSSHWAEEEEMARWLEAPSWRHFAIRTAT